MTFEEFLAFLPEGYTFSYLHGYDGSSVFSMGLYRYGWNGPSAHKDDLQTLMKHLLKVCRLQVAAQKRHRNKLIAKTRRNWLARKRDSRS